MLTFQLTNTKNPTRLVYLTDYWTVENKESQTVFETFITHMEDFLDLKRTEISLSDTWKATRPEGTDESLAKQFHHTFDWSANRDQWLGLLQPFIHEYTEKFGKPPIVNPQVRFKM